MGKMSYSHGQRRWVQAGTVLIGAIGASSARAAPAGSVTTVPGASSVPVLSGVGLLVLVLLVAVAAFWLLRNRAGGQKLASVVALAILATGGWASGRLGSAAFAAMPAYSLTFPNGEIVHISDAFLYTPVTLTNNTHVTLRIAAIVANPGFAFHGVASTCVSGSTVLPPHASCTVEFTH